jgi:DNA repair protein RecO (recombination protein O)
MRYGEADRILDLYTSNRGLISAIAKGIRRTRSRFGARLEPLACVEFMAYEGRTLDTITQAETLRSFHEVREYLPRFEAAGGMVAAVRALSGGDEADPRVFNLLYRGLDSLQGKTSGYATAEAAFGLKLSALAGYTPELDACVNCLTAPEEASGNPYFAPSLGGVLCSDCRAVAGDAFPLAPGAVRRLRTLISLPLRDATEDPIDESTRRVVRAHLLAHAPGATLTNPSARRA